MICRGRGTAYSTPKRSAAPVVKDNRQRGMRVNQRLVDRERLERRLFRLGHDGVRGACKTEHPAYNLNIGDTGVWLRIRGF